jgi:rapamycin-insensitive companion of mTOR
MLGALSSDPKGLAMMGKWCMFSMFYHLSDLNDREDLIQMFLGAMDFTL